MNVTGESVLGNLVAVAQVLSMMLHADSHACFFGYSTLATVALGYLRLQVEHCKITDILVCHGGENEDDVILGYRAV